jgi:hypothetical protein
MQTIGFSCKPVYDASQRTVIYIVYSITIKDTIQTDYPTTTDAQLELARVILQAQGGAFTYTGKGFGNFAINVNDVYDVVWGPKVTNVKATMKGNSYAWDIVWTVDVAIPECSTAAFLGTGSVLEAVYKVDYAIDKSGYSTQTIDGFIRIAQTRYFQADHTLHESADDYRENIYPNPIQGFRRNGSRFSLDESKCKLTFSITDEEMPPNYPGPGIVEARASHRIRNQEPYIMSMFIEIIEATYELAKGVSADNALQAFIQLVHSRTPPDNAKLNQTIVSFETAEPQIYGKTEAQFSITIWTWGGGVKQTGGPNIGKIVNQPGTPLYIGQLWTPVPFNSWPGWAQSLAFSAFDSRGIADLHYDTDNDALVDPCFFPPPTFVVPPPGTMNPPQPKPKGITVPQPQPGPTPPSPPYLGANGTYGSGLNKLFGFADPTPANSWIKFTNEVHFQSQSNDIVHMPLPSSPIVYPAGGAGSNFGNSSYGNPNVANGPQGEVPLTAPAAILQRRGAPSYVVHLRGSAIRAKYPVSQPQLLSIGGQKVVEQNLAGNGFRQSYFGDADIPIYRAEWDIRYIVLNAPAVATGVTPPPAPNLPTTMPSFPATAGGLGYPQAAPS